MTITIAVLVFTIAMFIWGRVRSDIVALTALALLLIFGILTPKEALAGFSSSIVIMMIGLFVVGGAIMQTGLAKMVGNRLMALAKGSESYTFILVMLVTSGIGAFVSNTGTVALMMPIVMSIAAQSGFSASRLLMPLAFAGSLGGMLTLIGTPPNLIIDEALQGAGEEPLSFFSFFPIGVVCIAVGMAVLFPLSRIFLSKAQTKKKSGNGKSLGDLVHEYNLTKNLCSYLVPAGSKMIGESLSSLGLQNTYGISVVEIRNRTPHRLAMMREVTQNMAWSDTVIQEGDQLYLIGSPDNRNRLIQDYGLVQQKETKLSFYDLGLAEIVTMPSSKYVGLSIQETRLRKRYWVNVLAIKRGGEYITDDLKSQVLHIGDVLLVQGEWKNLQQLNSESEDWVVISHTDQEQSRVLLDYKAPTAAAILVLMVCMMVFDFIPVDPVTAVIIAGLLTVFCGCFRNVEAAYKTINWESIVLIAAMMPMSTALEKTGVSAALSQALVSSLGSMGPTVLLAGVYFTTSLLTMFISNTATAVLMAPVALGAALAAGVHPQAFLFAVAVGASMCFASPFSTPPNALVMKAGGYTFMDYVKVGLPLQIIMGIVMTFFLPLLFPF